MSTSGKNWILTSSDKQPFEVEEAVASESVKIKHLIDDFIDENTIILPNGDDLQIKIQWLPSYSQLKTTLERFGFLFHFPGNPSSGKELIDSNSSNQGPPSNVQEWIKFVTSSCQARKNHPMISTSQAEELLGSVVFMPADRRVEDLSVGLHDCLQSCINFFDEEEWCTSCERVTKFHDGSSKPCQSPHKAERKVLIWLTNIMLEGKYKTSDLGGLNSPKLFVITSENVHPSEPFSSLARAKHGQMCLVTLIVILKR